MRLVFGQVGVVSRRELERVEHERDAWEARAHALASQLAVERSERIAERKQDPPRKSPRAIWASALTALWLILIGLFIGVVVPRAQGPTVLPDFAGCISKARYEHHIPGNQYQELVNALYTCQIYEGAS